MEVKLDQLQNFFKSVGLEDSDFSKLANEDVEDFTPFVEKAKSGIKDTLMGDSDFVDSLTRPFKDAPIGKEKQLKKEARKFFNLTLKEDELTKISLSEILELGTKNLKASDNSEIEKYKNAYSELLEENEKLKNEVIPNTISEVESKWKNISVAKDIKEELIGLVASETQVAKENLAMFSTTFQGYLKQLDLNLHLDEKRNLSIRDKDGLPAKNTEGAILRVKEALKDFATKMQVNIKPVGQGTFTNVTSQGKHKNLLEIMGKGLLR
jgi:hypothetical protein